MRYIFKCQSSGSTEHKSKVNWFRICYTWISMYYFHKYYCTWSKIIQNTRKSVLAVCLCIFIRLILALINPTVNQAKSWGRKNRTNITKHRQNKTKITMTKWKFLDKTKLEHTRTNMAFTKEENDVFLVLPPPQTCLPIKRPGGTIGSVTESQYKGIVFGSRWSSYIFRGIW